jgi:hypothetical protein
MWFTQGSRPFNPRPRPADDGYLLVLGAEQSFRERGLVAALRAFAGPVVSITPKSMTGKSRYFDHTLHGNPVNPQDALEAIARFERETGGCKPCAVVALNEWTLESSHAIATLYNLPFHEQETISNCRNKHQMKTCLQSHNLTCAKAVTVSTGVSHAGQARQPSDAYGT